MCAEAAGILYLQAATTTDCHITSIHIKGQLCTAKHLNVENIMDVNNVNNINGNIVLQTGESALALCKLYSVVVRHMRIASQWLAYLLAHMVNLYKRTEVPKYWKYIENIYMNQLNYAVNAIANRCRNVPNYSSFYSFPACQ